MVAGEFWELEVPISLNCKGWGTLPWTLEQPADVERLLTPMERPSHNVLLYKISQTILSWLAITNIPLFWTTGYESSLVFILGKWCISPISYIWGYSFSQIGAPQMLLEMMKIETQQFENDYGIPGVALLKDWSRSKGDQAITTGLKGIKLKSKTFQQWIAASISFSRSESILPFISQKRLDSPNPHNKYPEGNEEFALQ